MANFVVIVDPDPDRRSQFIKTIKPLLPLTKNLITNSCSLGNFHVIWSANKQAPISFNIEGENAAIIWGEAFSKTKFTPREITKESSTRIDAKTISTLWQNSPIQSCFDGFFAAVVFNSNNRLIVGADILGLFPIYYYTYQDVVLVGSSPELFKHHPSFQGVFNPVGLVGVLLTNGIINGQTLWQNVQRLNAGHLLTWQTHTGIKETLQYQINNSEKHQYAKLSFDEQLEILEAVIDQACTQHTPSTNQYSLLLSGGLDSRLLAGFVHRRGIQPSAITLGIGSDLDMQCAISVAKNLGLGHYPVNIEFEEYSLYANLTAKWEHLANGFNCVMDWGIQAHLSNFEPRAIAGYLMDRIIGGKCNYSLSTQNLSFETFFTQINAWGFSPQLLQNLLRQEVFGDLVQDTISQLRTIYNSYSDLDWVRAWCFEIYHRQRFHVGCAAWQLCFGAWPILPVLNRQLIETATALPVETIASRRAQKQLLCTRFPQLAQLPIARNNFNLEPILSNPNRQLYRILFDLQRKWKKLQQRLGNEQRYYYRTYDINNPGWLAIRKQAEPYRNQVKDLMHQDVFNQIVPTPDKPVQYHKDLFTDASGIKILLGLLLWSRDNL